MLKDTRDGAGPPLSLEVRENSLRFRISVAFRSPITLGLVLFVFVTSFPPFEAATELNLATHMLQHVLITISGVLMAYPLYRAGKFGAIRGRSTGLLSAFGIILLIVTWHIPLFWDAAVESFQVHLIEHASFLTVGILIGFAVPMLSDHFKIVLLILAISAHMFYGLALYLISTPIYNSPVSQQAFLGATLFAPSPVYFVGYLYFALTSESRKIEREEVGNLERTDPEYAARLKFERGKSGSATRALLKLSSVAVPLAILLMTVALVSYFAVAGAAIARTYGQSQGVTVYVVENPYYWQYSPQTVTVVLGVNNTVTWVSHSLSMATITSSAGQFNSGPISSGQTFSYTFQNAGTYTYYCEYHPWMQGKVIVLPPAG